MANSRRTKINYIPKMTDMEAYEKLDPIIRYYLKYSLTDWNAYSLYREQKKYGVNAALELLHMWNAMAAKQPWIPARGRRKAMRNACQEMNVSPMRG